MSHSTRAKRIEERRVERIKPGVCSTRGTRPEQARRYRSIDIMLSAGQPGMIDLYTARKLCGYKHARPSKYA